MVQSGFPDYEYECPHTTCPSIRALLPRILEEFRGQLEISDEAVLSKLEKFGKEILVELDDYCDKLRSPNTKKCCERYGRRPDFFCDLDNSERRNISYDGVIKLLDKNHMSVSKQTVVDAAKALRRYVGARLQDKANLSIIETLNEVRRERKKLSGVSKLTHEKLVQILTRRLQGYPVDRIANQLRLTANLVNFAIEGLISSISMGSKGVGVRQVYNPKSLRYFKIESRTIYPTDPEELLQAINVLIQLDERANTAEDFKKKGEVLARKWNKALKRYGVKLSLRKGSPFERRRRPYALRIHRRVITRSVPT